MLTNKQLKKVTTHLLLTGGFAFLTIFLTIGLTMRDARGDAEKPATFVPEQDRPAAVCSPADIHCSRWYYLTEKPRPDAWESDHAPFSKRQRWYHVQQPVAPAKPRIIVLEGVNFDFDKSDIRPDAVPILEKNLGELQSRNVRVKVVGHTDERGTDEYNQVLSEKRAQAIMNYYIQRGIPADRLSAEGRGESEPIALNEPVDEGRDTPEEHAYTDPGRAKNRRIELHIQDVVASADE